MKKSYYFLSGLPRTGSTLLSSLLSQNNKIYAGGNSPVCQLMWDMQVSVNTTSREQILANNKLDIANNLISKIPDLYYDDVKQNIIVDKCRSWTISANLSIIKKYITQKPKIIILIRPIEEIVNSFCDLYAKNNIKINPKSLLMDGSEPIMRSLNGIYNILQSEDKENYIIISYNDLVSNPQTSLDAIYKFCGWEHFNHTFNDITTQYPEDDSVYGLDNQHYVRPTISKRNVYNYLSKDIIDKCHTLNENFIQYS